MTPTQLIYQLLDAVDAMPCETCPSINLHPLSEQYAEYERAIRLWASVRVGVAVHNWARDDRSGLHVLEGAWALLTLHRPRPRVIAPAEVHP